MRVSNGWMSFMIGAALLVAGCGTTNGDGAAENGDGAAKMNDGGGAAAMTYEEVGGAKARAGFAVYEIDGKTWVFRRGSDDHEAFLKSGPSDKHSTKLMSGLTVKGPDMDTISTYLASRPGFAVDVIEGRVWVYRAGSEEWMDHVAKGPSDKHVTLFHQGQALKGPDMDTLRAYAAAR